MREFLIFKFRTMVVGADRVGTQVTLSNDVRVTKIGRVIRKFRLDEVPQLFNVFIGDMSFVGTRPEVPRYVQSYSKEMLATFLLPAGVTSEASIMFRGEDAMLEGASNAEEIYIKELLPAKMSCNLKALYRANIIQDLKTLARTVLAVSGCRIEHERG